MFNLFKRKKVKDWELNFLENVFLLLPKKYQKYAFQIQMGLLNGVVIDKTEDNYIGFKFNTDIIGQFESLKSSPFCFQAIKVWDNLSNEFVDVVIYIVSDLVTGYATPTKEKVVLNPNKIDVKSFVIKFFENKGIDSVAAMFSEEEAMVINLGEVYEVNLYGKKYYHLRDIEDGDFIGMDSSKNLFKITHDPVEIIPIQMSILQLFKD